MSKIKNYLFIALLLSFACGSEKETTIAPEEYTGISLVRNPTQLKVDVYLADELVTSYWYPGGDLKKPVLFPIKTAEGVSVTRPLPSEGVVNERYDHPHHVGHWLNYGDVNGFDFWNNSASVDQEQEAKMGTIVHQSIKKVNNRRNSASLEVSALWQDPNGLSLLREDTVFDFVPDPNGWYFDRTSTLTALQDSVRMTDNKEGMIAIRVRRALELASDQPERLIGPDGKPNSEGIVNNEGVGGNYMSSEGISGADVWGTRAKWMKLEGDVEGNPVTLAVIDHPDNLGFPSYWHARGYGLFSANPLGQSFFSDGAERLNFSMGKGEKTTFKYRTLVLSGNVSNDMGTRFESFSAK